MSSKRFVGRQVRASIALMASVALYRPLVTWAGNPWDLAAPQELFLLTVVAIAVQVGIWLILVKVGVPAMVAVTAVSGLTFVLLEWHSLPLAPPVVWLVIVLALATLLHFYGRGEWLKSIALLSMAVLVAAPAIQALVGHVSTAQPYEIVDLQPHLPVNATGSVEDVLVVIVDSYPSLRLARSWFGHDSTALDTALQAHGLTVVEMGWSPHTFTGLAIPALLELKPIVDEGRTPGYGNRRSTYERIRGDNLVASSLQSAGFKYTHIESGWDGARCGGKVDNCLRAPWFNEANWKLLEPTVFSRWLLSRYGNISVTGSKQVVSHLMDLRSRFDDGERDYVFAHMLLPHAPIVVDERCEVTRDDERTGILDPNIGGPESTIGLVDQLSCVDRLLMTLLDVVGDGTAVLIASDHGPTTRGQVLVRPSEWSDADIAERLGILLAYRLPSPCEQQHIESSLEAMRMIMTCAVEIDLPEDHGMYLIGAQDPEWVEQERMASIEDQLARGEITQSESRERQP